MKQENSDEEGLVFVQYDDNKMDHVLAGPDYGQPPTASKRTAWDELDSSEYPEYVSELRCRILKNPLSKMLIL